MRADTAQLLATTRLAYLEHGLIRSLAAASPSGAFKRRCCGCTRSTANAKGDEQPGTPCSRSGRARGFSAHAMMRTLPARSRPRCGAVRSPARASRRNAAAPASGTVVPPREPEFQVAAKLAVPVPCANGRHRHSKHPTTTAGRDSADAPCHRSTTLRAVRRPWAPDRPTHRYHGNRCNSNPKVREREQYGGEVARS